MTWGVAPGATDSEIWNPPYRGRNITAKARKTW